MCQCERDGEMWFSGKLTGGRGPGGRAINPTESDFWDLDSFAFSALPMASFGRLFEGIATDWWFYEDRWTWDGLNILVCNFPASHINRKKT